MSRAFDITVSMESRKPRVSASAVRSVTEKMLRFLGWTKAELMIRLMSDRKIHTINKKFLNHDEPTDVITFGYVEKFTPGMPFVGDIVISLETAKRQAAEYGNDFIYELYFYICHGVLHLMGDEDHKPKDRDRMLKKQADILKRIGVKNRV